MEGPGDKRSDERPPVGLLVRLRYGTIDEFVERFAVNVSRGGVFIRARDPKPAGTPVALELRLTTGETVFTARGVVRWIQAEDPAAQPPRAPGMGIQFTHLDPAARALVERMVTLREQRGGGVARDAAVAPRLDRTPLPARTATPATEIPLPRVPEPIARPSRAIVGIDLGTTNSCAAVVKNGRPYVIPSREGYNTVPSIVALNGRNKIVVGHLAKAQILTNPRQTVYGAKRLVGRTCDSLVVQEIKSKFAYEIVPSEDGLAAVRLGAETLSLEQISALILREVKEVAQNHLGEEVNRAVITVPAYYNERQRAAVRYAGALAGLHVERILNEPTAAALAYAYGRRVNQRVLVYDLGGGTFDASVLELHDNVYEVISTGGETFLGGVDFDACIVDRLLERYQEKAGQPFAGDRVALSRLVDAAERAKCALSERTDFAVCLPFLTMTGGQPFSLETTLTRAEIVELVEPLVDRTLEVCRDVLAAKGLSTEDIDEVLLVGGQSRMPLVQEKLAAPFGKPPSRSVHPEEAVAIGAALLAHSLGSAEGVVLIDVLPMSIGIGLPGGRVKTIIERNTPLPARKQYGLATTRDGQTEFELVILQGDGPSAADREYLGTLRLTGLPPGPRGMVKIAVTFELGAECLLAVTARELNTGREVHAVMSAREGAAAAQRRLDEGTGDDERTPAGAPAAPTPAPAPAQAASPPPAPPAAPVDGGPGGVGGLFRRLFGRREAR